LTSLIQNSSNSVLHGFYIVAQALFRVIVPTLT
jgi:hypothetical protein